MEKICLLYSIIILSLLTQIYLRLIICYTVYAVFIFSLTFIVNKIEQLCNMFYFVLTLFQYVYKPLLIGTVMILQHRCSNLLSVQCTVHDIVQCKYVMGPNQIDTGKSISN
jgi:hypothetical protein